MNDIFKTIEEYKNEFIDVLKKNKTHFDSKLTEYSTPSNNFKIRNNPSIIAVNANQNILFLFNKIGKAELELVLFIILLPLFFDLNRLFWDYQLPIFSQHYAAP